MSLLRCDFCSHGLLFLVGLVLLPVHHGSGYTRRVVSLHPLAVPSSCGCPFLPEPPLQRVHDGCVSVWPLVSPAPRLRRDYVIHLHQKTHCTNIHTGEEEKSFNVHVALCCQDGLVRELRERERHQDEPTVLDCCTASKALETTVCRTSRLVVLLLRVVYAVQSQPSTT